MPASLSGHRAKSCHLLLTTAVQWNPRISHIRPSPAGVITTQQQEARYGWSCRINSLAAAAGEFADRVGAGWLDNGTPAEDSLSSFLYARGMHQDVPGAETLLQCCTDAESTALPPPVFSYTGVAVLSDSIGNFYRIGAQAGTKYKSQLNLVASAGLAYRERFYRQCGGAEPYACFTGDTLSGMKLLEALAWLRNHLQGLLRTGRDPAREVVIVSWNENDLLNGAGRPQPLPDDAAAALREICRLAGNFGRFAFMTGTSSKRWGITGTEEQLKLYRDSQKWIKDRLLESENIIVLPADILTAPLTALCVTSKTGGMNPYHHANPH